MNILFISYGIKEYDGRLMELIKVSNNIGKTEMITCTVEKTNKHKNSIVIENKQKYLSFKLYIKFLIKCVYTAISMKNIDILFVDNYFATIPAHIIRIIIKPRLIIQDVRELYFIEDIKSFALKIFCKQESKLIKLSDIVICANEQRAEIMKERYKLKIKPLVFENIRVLSGNFDQTDMDIKYKSHFKYKYNLVCTGGFSILRRTDKLVLAMKELSNDYGLYIVGTGSIEDRRKLDDIIANYNLKNVHFLERVPMNELRYIVQMCHIGIVNYHQEDLNNKYCASGKVYEYIAEGLPIVTTENIPLLNFCNKTKTGESDNDFYKAILKVANNYEYYKHNVQIFLNDFSVTNNINEIVNKINYEINSQIY